MSATSCHYVHLEASHLLSTPFPSIPSSTANPPLFVLLSLCLMQQTYVTTNDGLKHVSVLLDQSMSHAQHVSEDDGSDDDAYDGRWYAW